MKRIVIAFMGIMGSCIAQQQITDQEFSSHINQKVTYCDKVYGTFISKGKNKVALLNLGADYPNQKLVVAIFEKNWKKFTYQPTEFLQNKRICVNGKLLLYKGKPEIIVEHPKQINVE
ncbi:MAG: hypothetical protein RBT46_04690 [Weeksellaceae bacterium]|jgi:micrococcal nuclease|nr:hypothetical protein [Weeksellaceae bacterium]MDX9704989.1 hypothetical protein [Weeksellaceae bacterium]